MQTLYCGPLFDNVMRRGAVTLFYCPTGANYKMLPLRSQTITAQVASQAPLDVIRAGIEKPPFAPAARPSSNRFARFSVEETGALHVKPHPYCSLHLGAKIGPRASDDLFIAEPQKYYRFVAH